MCTSGNTKAAHMGATPASLCGSTMEEADLNVQLALFIVVELITE